MHASSLIVSLALIAAAATYGGVAIFRRWAEKRQLMDMPNERSSHTRPTPRGGGLVIAVVTLICGTALAVALLPSDSLPAYASYVAGALLVATISWIDDLRSLSSAMRLAMHLAGAIIVILGLGYWDAMALPLSGTVTLGWWGAVASAVWIVGLTNAFNFMDGTDGIAGGQALIAGLGWSILGWQANQPFVSGLGLVVAGSSLGFLFHNWPPARIFMGDVGSAFLGYTLAVMPLIYGLLVRDSAGAPAVGLLLVWPFVFDTGFTLVRRLCKRENVFSAHRSHIYQRMSSARSGHTRVAFLYCALSAAGGMLAQVWTSNVVEGAVNGLLALPILGFGLWLLAVIHERNQSGSLEGG